APSAVVSYARYIVMLVYPADLAVWYPYQRNFSAWAIGGSIALLVSITALSVWQYRRRPFLMVGWLWFLGTLVPVIGVVQVGGQAIADRYTYVPYFGLFIMIVFGISSVVSFIPFRRKAVTLATAAALLVLTVVAARQNSYWSDNETLYRHTLAVTSNNYLIDHNLCHFYLLENRLNEAEPLCRR